LVTIDAVDIIRKKIPNFKFVLVGTTKRISKYVDKLGLSGFVVYLEPTSDFLELLKIYCIMDVYIAASAIGESFGMVIAEAMSCGIPIVTISTPKRDNAQVELVDNNLTGFVVQRHKRLVADAVLQIHNDKSIKNIMVQNSPVKILNLFEASRVVLSLQNLILSKFDYTFHYDNDHQLIVDWNDGLVKEYRYKINNVFGVMTFQEHIITTLANVLKYILAKCKLYV
jgi:glycosyltransferase involved in cell wall biosynthesis